MKEARKPDRDQPAEKKEFAMITIHGRADSGNVGKVMWAVAELGLEHRRLDVGGTFGGNHDAEFLRMNPNGLVPVLVDGDTTLWESNSIVRYLGARYGSGSLWPEDPAARAASDRWMDWGSMTLFPKVIAVFRADGEASRSKAIEEAQGPTRLLDEALNGRSFLAGEQLTIGDISVGVHLGRLFKFADKDLDRPHLRAYFERLLARPAYVEHCQQKLL